jgi:dihydroorotate dehydrogenase electron transfer subunit
VLANDQIGIDAWRLRLHSPALSTAEPGQFAMLSLRHPDGFGHAMPRPMAIYGRDRVAETADIVYRVVGRGTEEMSGWTPTDRVPVVGPLGRPFLLAASARVIVLLGRGIGTCSLASLAKDAAAVGVRVIAVSSARDAARLIGVEDYERAGVAKVISVVDRDGSSDPRQVADELRAAGAERADAFFVCGSARLLRLAADLAAASGASVQVSLEARMACGLGFCHGCAAGQRTDAQETSLVCVDGPVFDLLPENARG